VALCIATSYGRPGICGVEPGDRQSLSLVTVVRSSERAHASAAANGGRRFFFLEFRKVEAMVMEGPLAPWAAGAGRLKTLGHAPSTAARHMQLGGRLSRFLQERRLEISELNAGVLEEFFEDLHAYHGSSWPTPRSLTWLVEYLREVGVTPATPPPSPKSAQEELTDRYGAYLVWWRNGAWHARR
jgi:hypothetical protein